MRKYYYFCFLILCLASNPASAQNDTPTIHVELIIFKHQDISKDILNNLLEISFRPEDLTQPGYALFSKSTQTGIIDNIILSTEYRLEKEYQKLVAAEEFEVLHRVAWKQSQYSIDQAFFITVVPENIGGLLKGNARLTYDRLYQLKLNFLYDSDESLKLIEEIQPLEQTTTESRLIPIKMVKIMTHSKIYYLDHALLGVIAAIYE